MLPASAEAHNLKSVSMALTKPVAVIAGVGAPIGMGVEKKIRTLPLSTSNPSPGLQSTQPSVLDNNEKAVGQLLVVIRHVID